MKISVDPKRAKKKYIYIFDNVYLQGRNYKSGPIGLLLIGHFRLLD